MVSTPDNHDAVIDSRIVEALVTSQTLAYAVVAPNLTIIQHSPNFAMLVDESAAGGLINGAPLGYLVPEFAPRTAALAALLTGTMALLQLDDVSRPQPNGSILYLCCRVLPLVGTMPSEGLLLLVEDSTVTQGLQQQRLEMLGELREFAAEMAKVNSLIESAERFKALTLSMATHDLRSPLAAIFGYVDLMLGDLEGISLEEQQEFLTVIHIQAQRMNRLITSLLDLDQLEQGKLLLNTVPLDFNVIAREVAEENQATTSLHGVTLTLAPSSRPLPLLADSTRLKQLLQGLLDIAVRETPAGETILLRLAPTPDGAPTKARFRLSHVARPLTEAQQRHLFDLYAESGDARQSWPPEIRLTIFLIRAFVEAHHGTFTVANREDGSRLFTIDLPLDPDARLAE